jgi:GNAT superfamily N-acetyltransferase
LKVPSRQEFELNELEWWGNWAKLEWVRENTYLLTSKKMPEVFFNRGGLVACQSFESSITRLEERFHAMGLGAVITVRESCSGAMRKLAGLGYRKVDGMAVLAATRSHGQVNNPEVRIGPAQSGEGWSGAYLSAFYGGLDLMPTVGRVVRRLRRTYSTLLEARIGGQVAGVLALHRTGKLAGAYCVGTVPKFRRRGVAGMLLARGREIASSEGRVLFLQALESEGAGRFYLKRGFDELYRKALMQKKG